MQVAGKSKNAILKTKEKCRYDNVEHSEESPSVYAENSIRDTSMELSRKAIHNAIIAAKKTYNGGKASARNIKQKEHVFDRIKKTEKTAGKEALKRTQKTIKTADNTLRVSIKTTKQADKTAKQVSKTAKKASQRAANAAKKSAEAARATTRAAVKTLKVAVKATISSIKASTAALKELVAVIASGGWISVIIILLITMVALIVGSGFGLFYSADNNTDSGIDIHTVISDINDEYLVKIEDIKSSNEHDVLEMSGSRAVWSDVLAVYSVKVACDPDDPREVATMDSDKLELLKEIFWDMNVIDYRTETLEDIVITETDNGSGNISETEETQERVHLYITVSHKSVDEMASEYGFTDEQNKQLNELIDERNRGLWDQFLFGIKGANGDIVAMALTQIGNVGGEPYWSWYGFSSRVEWCCCFVSWCADRCGYIESGVIPKFAGCAPAVEWFRERNEWQDNTYTPKAGDIIFFDWQENGITGTADHIGIVEKVENGIITTVEGNTGDSCAERHYAVGHFEIFGYGLPSY